MRFDREWKRFLSTDALSQTVVVTVLSIVTVNRLLTVTAAHPERIVDFLIPLTLPTVVAWLVFSIAGAGINRFTTEPSVVRSILVITTFVVTGLVREILLIVSPGNPDVILMEPIARLVTAAVTSTVLFLLVAGFIGDARKYSRELAALARTRTELQKGLTLSGRRFDELRHERVSEIQQTLVKAFRPFVDENPGIPEAGPRGIQELSRITEAVVQPLSVSLAQGANIRTIPSELPSDGKIQINKVFDVSTRVDPFRPGYYIGASILIDAPAFVTILTWGERIFGIAVIFALWAVHVFARHRLSPFLGQHRIGLRILAVFSIYVLSLTPVAFFMFVVLGGGWTGLGIAVFGILFGVIFLGLGAAAAGLDTVRNEILSLYIVENRQLEWNVARINSQMWVEQRRLATFIHGEIQSLILAAQLTIQRAVDSGAGLDEVLTNMRELIRDVPNSLMIQRRHGGINQLVESLIDRWGQHVSITVDCDQVARSAVGQDPTGLAVIEEVVTEFVVNAIKHGKASAVSLQIGVDDDVAVLTFSNNRNAEGTSTRHTVSRRKSTPFQPSRTRSGGLGSQLIESVTLERTEVMTPTRFELRASVPLETPY